MKMDILLILQNLLFIILIVLICVLIWIFVIAKIARKIHPFPIPAFFTKVIDNKIRRKFIQKPETIARNMNLKPGMIVLELGPGKGNYTKAVAEKILPDGKVYAFDISKYIIDKLKKRVDNEGILNIIPRIEDAYNLSFENDSVDRIFAIACLPEIPKPVDVLIEFKRVLKPGGIVSLCELFIDPDYPLRKTEKKWANKAGLQFQTGFGNFFVYQLNFVKE